MGILWLVVGGGGYILAGGGWWWIYFGWWWVVGGGIVWPDPLKYLNEQLGVVLNAKLKNRSQLKT